MPRGLWTIRFEAGSKKRETNVNILDERRRVFSVPGKSAINAAYNCIEYASQALAIHFLKLLKRCSDNCTFFLAWIFSVPTNCLNDVRDRFSLPSHLGVAEFYLGCGPGNGSFPIITLNKHVSLSLMLSIKLCKLLIQKQLIRMKKLFLVLIKS